MDPDREKIEDLMSRYGYEEDEAEAAHHLRQAWSVFDKMYEGAPGSKAASKIFKLTFVDTHFEALFGMLGNRVLKRNYPGGWGRRPAPDEEHLEEE